MLRRRFPNAAFVSGRIDASGKTSNDKLESAFSAADLLIHNSGMPYNSFWKSPSILEACLNRQKPICLYGQSFDGFQKEDVQTMAERLSETAAIYCRDVESFEYLRAIGVRPPILEFGPDGCFGIDLRDDARASAYLKSHKLEPKTVYHHYHSHQYTGRRKTESCCQVGCRRPHPEPLGSDRDGSATNREMGERASQGNNSLGSFYRSESPSCTRSRKGDSTRKAILIRPTPPGRNAACRPQGGMVEHG